MSAKVAVITSGQAGIGQEITAQLLLHRIAAVYILARTEFKYTDAKTEWAEKGGLSKDDLDTRTLFVRCDLSDIADVNRVADHLLTKLDRLNILINNAVPEYTLSPQASRPYSPPTTSATSCSPISRSF